MIPEAQTLFSVTLFLALSSLLAWSNRRNRSRQLGDPMTVSTVQSARPVR